MPSSPIAFLRDTFSNGIIDPCWTASTIGSATVSEVSGQAVLTLPSSTAGSHLAYERTNGTYDLTGDGFYININTMVATGVAATVYFYLLADVNGANGLYWRQVSNAITARTIVGGVDTQLFTATWSASTYKYLRISESGGTITFASSTNGTSWTTRATVANPFAVTDLYVQITATCGNVASPGSLKLDDVNLILPALSTTWRWIQCERPSSDYVKTITLAFSSGQGYIATADSVDASGNLTNVKYYSGPVGSASGAYNQLVEYSSLATAESNAANLPDPTHARWDLPSLVQCRIVRLYMRSITGSPFLLGEMYPRRLVQSDDIEAESIKAINIAAGTITADKITVLNLAALSAQMGALHMDGVIDIDTAGGIYQGSGTFAAPTTGLKLFNSGGVGKLSGYNAGVEQITLDTDGVLKAGAGSVVLNAGGISIASAVASSGDPIKSYKFNISGVEAGGAYGFLSGTQNTLNVLTQALTGKSSRTEISSLGLGTTSTTFAKTALSAIAGASVASVTLTADPIGGGVARDITAIADGITLSAATFISLTGPVTVTGALNTSVINATGAVHVPRSSGSALFALDGTDMGSALSIANNGTANPFGNTDNFSGLMIISETGVTGSAAVFLTGGGGGGMILVSQTSTFFSNTVTTAGKANVYLVGGVVTIENKLGSTGSFNIMAFRTRSV